MTHVAPETPKKKPKKATEFERVTNYRFEALVLMGLAPDQAISLVEIADVVHSAQKLADQGCPPHIIARLLGN